MADEQPATQPATDESRARAIAGDLRVLASRLRRRLREQATLGDFTPSQMSALLHLEKTPATLTELAHAQGVRPQSMGATVAALEAATLIASAPDPNDGRKIIWSLTAEARERVMALRAMRADWLTRAIRRELNDDEQARLQAALTLIERLVVS